MFEIDDRKYNTKITQSKEISVRVQEKRGAIGLYKSKNNEKLVRFLRFQNYWLFWFLSFFCRFQNDCFPLILIYNYFVNLIHSLLLLGNEINHSIFRRFSLIAMKMLPIKTRRKKGKSSEEVDYSRVFSSPLHPTILLVLEALTLQQ